MQEEADKQVREEERRKSLERGELTPELGSEKEKEGEEGEGEEEKGGKETGTWRKEQWRKQIREDVDDLVRGGFRLSRLLHVSRRAITVDKMRYAEDLTLTPSFLL